MTTILSDTTTITHQEVEQEVEVINTTKENEIVEIWEKLLAIQSNMHVVVVSDNGWAWVLAWMQVGVTTITAYPMSKLAEEQLHLLRDNIHLRNAVTPVTSVEALAFKNEDKITIICTHVSSISSLDSFSDIVDTCATIFEPNRYITTVSVGATHVRQSQVEKILRHKYTWQVLRHTKLGGLTTARMHIGWRGTDVLIAPGATSYPKRPLDRFLEPAVKKQLWRRVSYETSDCWRPSSIDASPYPWPWRGAPSWVEAYSVFQKTMIERKFTDKEWCQLLDLRSDWSQIIPLLMEWNDGCMPPLRMFVEFILSLQMIVQRERINFEASKEQQEDLKKHFDWGRIRAPWLGNSPHTPKLNLERMLYFGWTWEDSDYLSISIACRGDDAQVNLDLWAIGGNSPQLEQARATIRSFLWSCWKRKICKEAISWYRKFGMLGPDREKNLEAVKDCLSRCINSDWWNWDDGSRLFFWRWPELWRLEARDGAPGFHTSTPRPQMRFGQIPIEEEWVKEKDLEKLEKLIRRRYITEGFCRTTVPRFPVPKGEDDIRVVWDLSKNGLNETMYTPSFFLATMGTYLRRIDIGFYGGDFDVGEQFHNYVLHEAEQIYCGVEIPQQLRDKLSNEGFHLPKYMRWNRLVFGWQSSPYMALRMFARAIELAKGSPEEPNSAFHWDRVVLNLPGTTHYNPAKPRVMRFRPDGLMAADIVTFYDDGRVVGPNEEEANKAIRQITSRIQYYGNQDAARKRRAVSQRPGAWAGGVAYSDQGLLRKFISQEKWDRTRTFLDWVWDQLQNHDGLLDRKLFCSGKGFLVHVSLCYEFMVPYMKGFHLSENAWRDLRDDDGWKLEVPQSIQCKLVGETQWEDNDDEVTWFSVFDHFIDSGKKCDKVPPPQVKAVPRLWDDVQVLRMFFALPTPVQIIVRPVEGSTFVAYGGGDASGEGFGGQITPLGMKPLLRRGFWCLSDSENSSNWRELRNLIDVVREEAKSGRLTGRELWLATDNSTAANAFYRGTSTSRTLHDMVTELRLLTLEGNFILHLYHIAGTRMIQSGIDALSRGELNILALENAVGILMPLHLSPIKRSPDLIEWLRSWLDDEFSVCKPNDWFYKAHQAGEYALDTKPKTWVWDLPPAAALHAIEELGFARLKRHDILRGVVIIPSLLSNEWFRRFAKTVDVYFTIPPGSIPEWSINMHESLTVGIYLPLFRHQPWDWKQVPFMVPFGSALSALHKAGDTSTRDILREFWWASSRVASLPKSLVRNLLQNPSWKRFLHLSTRQR